MNAHGQLRDVVQGICFVTHPSYITEARRQWERRTTNAIMDFIVLPALPRKALVEWQVWAHSHNDKFDCKLKILNIHFCFTKLFKKILKLSKCRRRNWLFSWRLHNIQPKKMELRK